MRTIAANEQKDAIMSAIDINLSINGSVILEKVSIDISSKGITAILGFNGSGKSSLLRALNGRVRLDLGEVRFLKKKLTRQTKKMHGFVLQEPIFLRRSVMDNLRFHVNTSGLAFKECELERILDSVGLLAKKTQDARSLSGGEKQRLSIACAVARQPKIIFLDEPTASLDPEATDMIERILTEIDQQGTKLVMVTHDIRQAKLLSSDVVFLANGRVMEHTQSNNFFDNPKSQKARKYLFGR